LLNKAFSFMEEARKEDAWQRSPLYHERKKGSGAKQETSLLAKNKYRRTMAAKRKAIEVTAGANVKRQKRTTKSPGETAAANTKSQRAKKKNR
jgi:hypothetical protein